MKDHLLSRENNTLLTLGIPDVTLDLRGSVEAPCKSDPAGLWFWNPTEVWCLERNEEEFLAHPQWEGTPHQVAVGQEVSTSWIAARCGA